MRDNRFNDTDTILICRPLKADESSYISRAHSAKRYNRILSSSSPSHYCFFHMTVACCQLFHRFVFPLTKNARETRVNVSV